MNLGMYGALRSGDDIMTSILHFAHRNARIVALATMAVGVVLAGTIGWVTAPV
jgi:hypothetical protein